MLRPVLIIAFVGTDLSFFLSEWRGRRGWRYGRLTRILALVELNLVLVLGLFRFRYVTPETLSLCYLSAALSLLLLPVPPNKGARLPVLSAAGLAAVPAALFLPAVCPYVLVADLLLARSTLALRRRELMELLSRGITLRKTLEQAIRPQRWRPVSFRSSSMPGWMHAGAPVPAFSPSPPWMMPWHGPNPAKLPGPFRANPSSRTATFMNAAAATCPSAGLSWWNPSP